MSRRACLSLVLVLGAGRASAADDCAPDPSAYTILDFVSNSEDDVGSSQIRHCASTILNIDLPGVVVKQCRDVHLKEQIQKKTRLGPLIQSGLVLAILGDGTRLEHRILAYENDVDSAGALSIGICPAGKPQGGAVVAGQYEQGLAALINAAIALHEWHLQPRDCGRMRLLDKVFARAICDLRQSSLDQPSYVQLREQLSVRYEQLQGQLASKCAPNALNQRVARDAPPLPPERCVPGKKG